MGHSYSAIFRVTPLAGPAFTVDLTNYQWKTRAQPLYEPVIAQKEMLDRSVRQTRYGYRCRVLLDFEFPTPSTDETAFARDLLTVAADDDQSIELSLDGGTTYRTVLLEQMEQAALADKNIGVRVSTAWVCRDLLTTKPAVGSGSW